jgi:hypothetical protein
MLAGDTFELRGDPKASRTNPRWETARGPVLTTRGMVTDDLDSSVFYREDGQSAAKPLRPHTPDRGDGYEERPQTKWKWVGPAGPA